MELVSAIITTRNRHQLCQRAIGSVFTQTYPNLECIVVDDASDEGRYGVWDKDERIKYIFITKEESSGGNHARNVGIKAAKGKYVAFLDDDDYWIPNKIEKQVALIQKKKCDVVYGGMRAELVAKDGSVRYEDWAPHEGGEGDLSKKVLTKIYTTTSGLLVTKDALEKVGFFDEKLRYWQEYELVIRLAQISEIYAVHESVFVYRIDEHDSQRLTNKYRTWKDSVAYVHKKHRMLYRSLPYESQAIAMRMYHGEAYYRAKRGGERKWMKYHQIMSSILKRVIIVLKKI